MSKRDAMYQNLVFENDNLSLPAGETERKQIARSLFGAILVACADAEIQNGEKILADPVEFADFTADQKKKVLALISHLAYGALYSQCVRIDQFPGAALEISVVELEENDDGVRSTVIISPDEQELRHSFYDWAERFGDHYDPDYIARLAYHRP